MTLEAYPYMVVRREFNNGMHSFACLASCSCSWTLNPFAGRRLEANRMPKVEWTITKKESSVVAVWQCGSSAGNKQISCMIGRLIYILQYSTNIVHELRTLYDKYSAPLEVMMMVRENYGLPPDDLNDVWAYSRSLWWQSHPRFSTDLSPSWSACKSSIQACHKTYWHRHQPRSSCFP